MLVQIPLTKLRNKEAVNKMEVTSIDPLLSVGQKRRIAMFYRQEEAKRTRYNPEPSWELPTTIQATRRPSATGMTWDDFLKQWVRGSEEAHNITPTEPQEKAASSGSSSLSETESETITRTIKQMIDKHPGTSEEVRKSILEAKQYLKDFENISKARIRRLIYREKSQRIKTAQRQRHP
ncbi:unnamed protein product [Macrosiphum euphorbiae]|uniref:Uncharacterized protein n=1 Tax=Macrosiphum euphorbiae TaxID=13131 RepID=A0AAV0WXE8_9HEMI|nr:unnamed protein product [Macrosiphum euphorbiae]